MMHGFAVPCGMPPSLQSSRPWGTLTFGDYEGQTCRYVTTGMKKADPKIRLCRFPVDLACLPDTDTLFRRQVEIRVLCDVESFIPLIKIAHDAVDPVFRR